MNSRSSSASPLSHWRAAYWLYIVLSNSKYLYCDASNWCRTLHSTLRSCGGLSVEVRLLGFERRYPCAPQALSIQKPGCCWSVIKLLVHALQRAFPGTWTLTVHMFLSVQATSLRFYDYERLADILSSATSRSRLRPRQKMTFSWP